MNTCSEAEYHSVLRRRDDLDRVLLDPEEVGPRLEGGAHDRAERAAVLRREHVSDVVCAKPACLELPERSWVAAVHVRPAHLAAAHARQAAGGLPGHQRRHAESVPGIRRQATAVMLGPLGVSIEERLQRRALEPVQRALARGLQVGHGVLRALAERRAHGLEFLGDDPVDESVDLADVEDRLEYAGVGMGGRGCFVSSRGLRP